MVCCVEDFKDHSIYTHCQPFALFYNHYFSSGDDLFQQNKTTPHPSQVTGNWFQAELHF